MDLMPPVTLPPGAAAAAHSAPAPVFILRRQLLVADQPVRPEIGDLDFQVVFPVANQTRNIQTVGWLPDVASGFAIHLSGGSYAKRRRRGLASIARRLGCTLVTGAAA
jgi:hypothetical protein